MAGTIWRVVVLAAGILAGFAVGFSAALLTIGTDYTRACVVALAVCVPLLALFGRELIGMWKFPDERPLGRAEILESIAGRGRVVFEKTLWPLVYSGNAGVLIRGSHFGSMTRRM